MLVHICCSVDSHFFLQKLRQNYPNESIIGYFYDPNIHPYEEYLLRLIDVKRSCESLGFKLLVGEYDFESWIDLTKGYENEPERGKRCDICFDARLINTAKKAIEIKEKVITTTLFASPKKDFNQLKNSLNLIQQRFGIEVLMPDFRVNGGTNEQMKLAKEDKLYHQDYCGCIFALNAQRSSQKKLNQDIFLPLNKQVQPKSVLARLKLYEKIQQLSKDQQNFSIKREKILNYRLKRAFLKVDKKVIDSYFLCYSFLKRKFTKGKIEAKNDEFANFSRDEILIISLKHFNILSKQNYKSTKDLIYHPIKFSEEIRIRNLLQSTYFSLSPIVVVDKIQSFNKAEIFCDAEIYDDVIEILEML